MAAHKLVNMIDPSRAKLVFELLRRDVIHVAIAQAVERCVHYANLDPSLMPAKPKKGKRYGITITAADGTEFETVRVGPQLVATAFSETFRSLRGPMQCNGQHDFLFYLHGIDIVDTDGKRYTLAVDGNRFILKVTGIPLLSALAAQKKKASVAPVVVPYPNVQRNDVGDLTPATRRAFRDLWNSLLADAKEPLATISENCLLKTPRYLANVTRVEIWFARGREGTNFDLAYVAKGAIDGSEPRTLGKAFPLTAKGIADALHSLRIRNPLPSGNVAAKPSKAEAKKEAPKPAKKKPTVQLGAGSPVVNKPEAKKVAPAKKPESKPVPAPFTTDRDTTGPTASTPKAEA